MKNIIILVALVIGLSAIAEANAKLKIRKFQIIKTQDGKLQFCNEGPDYYQPATYSLHLEKNEVTQRDQVETKVLAVGKKCQRYKTPGTDNYLYVWRELDLFEEYKYEVVRYFEEQFIEEYVTVKSAKHTLIVADRSFKTLSETKLDEAFWGTGEGTFEVDLKKGILPDNLQQYERGQVVSSVFFVYIRTQRTQVYSWNRDEDTFLHSGAAYSFIYYIQKK